MTPVKIAVGTENSPTVKRLGLAVKNQRTINHGMSVVKRVQVNSFDELRRSIEPWVCSRFKIVLRYFGDYLSEVKGQIEPKSFFESQWVHKEILKRLSRDLRTTPVSVWRLCIREAVPLLSLGIHAGRVFDQCLKRFDHRIEDMVDQAITFDSTNKFVQDLQNALHLSASPRPRELAKCIVDNFGPGETAPAKAKCAALAMVLVQDSATARELKRALANLDTWKAFNLASGASGSILLTPQSLTFTAAEFKRHLAVISKRYRKRSR
jgi:hypothetical protein